MSTLKQTNKSCAKTKVPRNFILLESLNKTGNYTHVTYGLMDEKEDDQKLKSNYVKMEFWNASLMYDDGENMNIFELSLHVPLSYPKDKLSVQFSKAAIAHKRVKKICDSEGKLTDSALAAIKWSESMLLGDYLNEILNLVMA